MYRASFEVTLMRGPRLLSSMTITTRHIGRGRSRAA